LFDPPLRSPQSGGLLKRITMNEYSKRQINHYKALQSAEHRLWLVLQTLSPGHWVLNIDAYFETNKAGLFEPIWRVSCHNGDDSISAEGNTLGQATAKVILSLLGGAVYPLGGEGGRYVHPENLKD